MIIDGQLKQKIAEFQSHLQIEQDLRNKNEVLLNTSRQVEFLNRQKDEELLTYKRHIEKGERDMKGLIWIESQQKMEIQALK